MLMLLEPKKMLERELILAVAASWLIATETALEIATEANKFGCKTKQQMWKMKEHKE